MHPRLRRFPTETSEQYIRNFGTSPQKALRPFHIHLHTTNPIRRREALKAAWKRPPFLVDGEKTPLRFAPQHSDLWILSDGGTTIHHRILLTVFQEAPHALPIVIP